MQNTTLFDWNLPKADGISEIRIQRIYDLECVCRYKLGVFLSRANGPRINKLLIIKFVGKDSVHRIN